MLCFLFFVCVVVVLIFLRCLMGFVLGVFIGISLVFIWLLLFLFDFLCSDIGMNVISGWLVDVWCLVR